MFLHLGEDSLVDDGLMGVWNDHPILLRHRLDVMHLVAFHPAAALDQVPGVDAVCQERIDYPRPPQGIRRPPARWQPLCPPVGRWAGNVMLVEIEGDGPFGRTLQEQGEDELYHLGGIGIDHQLVLILRGFYIAVRGKGADVLAVPPLVVEHLPDLFGSLKAVVVIDNI